MSKILLASNEETTSGILTKLLKTEGYKVVGTSVLSQAQEFIETDEFDLMIANTGKDFDPELNLIKSAQTHKPTMPIIAIKETDDPETSALIDEYKPFASMEKPLKVDRLLITVQQAIDFQDKALTEDVNLNLQLEKKYQFENIVAESPAMKSVCDMISRVAAIDVTILLLGESGTGKRDVAETIHANSSRKEGPFQSVDCGDAANVEKLLFGDSGTQGALEQAAGGTVFLREVNKLAIPIQEKLKSALMDRNLDSVGKENTAIDVRIVASTSQDLDELSGRGKFSPALYKILKVILIKIQPLRNRPQDVMPTIRNLLQKKVGDGQPLPSMDQDVVDVLEKHPWPGNMDSIEKVLNHILKKMSNNKITKDCLPADLG